jgi:hypothetical protein
MSEGRGWKFAEAPVPAGSLARPPAPEAEKTGTERLFALDEKSRAEFVKLVWSDACLEPGFEHGEAAHRRLMRREEAWNSGPRQHVNLYASIPERCPTGYYRCLAAGAAVALYKISPNPQPRSNTSARPEVNALARAFMEQLVPDQQDALLNSRRKLEMLYAKQQANETNKDRFVEEYRVKTNICVGEVIRRRVAGSNEKKTALGRLMERIVIEQMNEKTGYRRPVRIFPPATTAKSLHLTLPASGAFGKELTLWCETAAKYGQTYFESYMALYPDTTIAFRLVDHRSDDATCAPLWREPLDGKKGLQAPARWCLAALAPNENFLIFYALAEPGVIRLQSLDTRTRQVVDTRELTAKDDHVVASLAVGWHSLSLLTVLKGRLVIVGFDAQRGWFTGKRAAPVSVPANAATTVAYTCLHNVQSPPSSLFERNREELWVGDHFGIIWTLEVEVQSGPSEEWQPRVFVARQYWIEDVGEPIYQIVARAGRIATLSTHKYHIFHSHDMSSAPLPPLEGIVGFKSFQAMTMHGSFLVILRDTGHVDFFNVSRGSLEHRKVQLANVLERAGIKPEGTSLSTTGLLAYAPDGETLWVHLHHSVMMAIRYEIDKD